MDIINSLELQENTQNIDIIELQINAINVEPFQTHNTIESPFDNSINLNNIVDLDIESIIDNLDIESNDEIENKYSIVDYLCILLVICGSGLFLTGIIVSISKIIKK